MALSPDCGVLATSPKQGSVPIQLPSSLPVTLSILNLWLRQFVAMSLMFVNAWSARLSIYTILGLRWGLADTPCSLMVRAYPWYSGATESSPATESSSALTSLKVADWATTASFTCFMAYATCLSCPESGLCLSSAALDLPRLRLLLVGVACVLLSLLRPSLFLFMQFSAVWLVLP